MNQTDSGDQLLSPHNSWCDFPQHSSVFLPSLQSSFIWKVNNPEYSGSTSHLCPTFHPAAPESASLTIWTLPAVGRDRCLCTHCVSEPWSELAVPPQCYWFCTDIHLLLTPTGNSELLSRSVKQEIQLKGKIGGLFYILSKTPGGVRGGTRKSPSFRTYCCCQVHLGWIVSYVL